MGCDFSSRKRRPICDDFNLSEARAPTDVASKHRHAVPAKLGSDGVETSAVDTPDRHRGLVQPVGDLVALITN